MCNVQQEMEKIIQDHKSTWELDLLCHNEVSILWLSALFLFNWNVIQLEIIYLVCSNQWVIFYMRVNRDNRKNSATDMAIEQYTTKQEAYSNSRNSMTIQSSYKTFPIVILMVLIATAAQTLIIPIAGEWWAQLVMAAEAYQHQKQPQFWYRNRNPKPVFRLLQNNSTMCPHFSRFTFDRFLGFLETVFWWNNCKVCTLTTNL